MSGYWLMSSGDVCMPLANNRYLVMLINKRNPAEFLAAL